ncbi:hypothetical protein KAI87_04660, partial [Myxococcota bacterium]|nr:hypothetical protein [Myxococcota bacterium]
GREVRVFVAGEEKGEGSNRKRGGKILKDHELHPLAEEIARTLEEELTFAGQIRVTVIRESRAISIAA